MGRGGPRKAADSRWALTPAGSRGTQPVAGKVFAVLGFAYAAKQLTTLGGALNEHRDSWDDEPGGARLRDLTRDGYLAPIVDAILRPVEAERDAFREVAIKKELELRALREVEAEADRRVQGRAHLRAV